MATRRSLLSVSLLAATLAAGGCAPSPEGIARSRWAQVTVKLDFLHRPLPDIPLPNDLATRHDPASATGRRINASMVAPTVFERRTRTLVDGLDGWGVYAPITVPFSGPLDLRSIVAAHHGDDYALADDVVYLIDVTPGSSTYGEPAVLDIGQGNFPVTLEQMGGYWEGDSRPDTISLAFEEHDEDTDGDGVLDPGEDTDLDGVLDRPNYGPGVTAGPGELTLAQRADALTEYWERETNTLILRVLRPLRERTTYAVVVTRRLKDEAGAPVGSPYDYVNHTAQTEALSPLEGILQAHPEVYGGLSLADVAFAWSYTTGSMWADFRAVRDGLYGLGPQAHLATAFPAEVEELHDLHDGEPGYLGENRYTVAEEHFMELMALLDAAGVVSIGEEEVAEAFHTAARYVDVHAVASFSSPQLLPRKDADGRTLGYNEMVWPADLDLVPAEAEPERVTCWLTLPRKETSARGEGKPAPLLILGHGYTGSKTEVASFHTFFSRYGLAVLALDNVSHGFGLSEEEGILGGVLGSLGVTGFGAALMDNRSWDQDLDGREDSGADFWTAYAFHTRDVVRQSAVDYMQLIRVVRAWDGERRWEYDVNGNGEADDVAGDFDGDGAVDFGGPDGVIVMTGGSLGGIMSTVVGGLEPELAAVLPIAGGGGLGDVGVRSIQGGVREALQLRVMGPLYVGAPDPAQGDVVVRTVVPSLNDDARFEVARIPADVAAELSGGTVYAANLSNGEYDCARVVPDAGCVAGCGGDSQCESVCLTFRVGLASDVDEATPQRHRLTFYRGDVFLVGVVDPERHRACARLEDPAELEARTLLVVDSFSEAVDFHHRSRPLRFEAGAPLAPLAEGMGLHRARPELRRFLHFAQLVLDPADPAVHAKNLQSGEMEYATGEVVETRALVLNTVGDMNVPVSGGAAIGRAAGLLDYEEPIPQWGGRTVNQVLVDTYVLEAVDTVKRFVDGSGRGVLFDPENLSGSAWPSLPPRGERVAWEGPPARGNDGYEVPRLDPPLHTFSVKEDGLGGWSGTFFPFVVPGGKHGFLNPGEDLRRLRKACEAQREAAGEDPATCADEPRFDHAMLVIGMAGRYLRSGGEEFRLEPCMVDMSCDDIPPPPEARGRR